MLKWGVILVVGIIVYMITIGDMGGAKKATNNYQKVMRG